AHPAAVGWIEPDVLRDPQQVHSPVRLGGDAGPREAYDAAGDPGRELRPGRVEAFDVETPAEASLVPVLVERGQQPLGTAGVRIALAPVGAEVLELACGEVPGSGPALAQLAREDEVQSVARVIVRQLL